MLVGEALASDPRERQFKPFAVVHVFAIVVTEALLVQIAKEVEWLDTHIGTVDTALQQAPEVFQPIAMNPSIHLAARHN